MMARSTNAPFTGRIQKRKTNPLRHSHPACNTRPVHTEVPEADVSRCSKALFDHLVGAAKKRQRDIDSQCLGGFKIDYQLDLR